LGSAHMTFKRIVRRLQIRHVGHMRVGRRAKGYPQGDVVSGNPRDVGVRGSRGERSLAVRAGCFAKQGGQGGERGGKLRKKLGRGNSERTLRSVGLATIKKK